MFEAECHNISYGGMYLESSKCLSRDTELSLSFLLPEVEEKIEVSGKVKWLDARKHRYGVGIQFFSPITPRGLKPQHLWALNLFFAKGAPS